MSLFTEDCRCGAIKYAEVNRFNDWKIGAIEYRIRIGNFHFLPLNCCFSNNKDLLTTEMRSKLIFGKNYQFYMTPYVLYSLTEKCACHLLINFYGDLPRIINNSVQLEALFNRVNVPLSKICMLKVSSFQTNIVVKDKLLYSTPKRVNLFGRKMYVYSDMQQTWSHFVIKDSLLENGEVLYLILPQYGLMLTSYMSFVSLRIFLYDLCINCKILAPCHCKHTYAVCWNFSELSSDYCEFEQFQDTMTYIGFCSGVEGPLSPFIPYDNFYLTDSESESDSDDIIPLILQSGKTTMIPSFPDSAFLIMLSSAVGKIDATGELEKYVTPLFLFAINVRKSCNMDELSLAFLNFSITLSQGSLVLPMKKIFDMLSGIFNNGSLQSEFHWSTMTEEIFENWDMVRNSLIGQRVCSVTSHIIFHSLMHKLHIDIDPVTYDKFERNAIRIHWTEATSFSIGCLKIISISLKQGYQYYKTGKLSSFFLNETSVNSYMERVNKVAMYLKNLHTSAGISMDLFEIIRDIETLDKEGEELRKCFTPSSNCFKTLIFLKLKVKEMKMEMDNWNLQSAYREQPFAVNFMGYPGIGKSNLMNLARQNIGQLYGLPLDMAYKYDVPQFSDHFDNFRSYMWCIYFDDLAQKNMSELKESDKSVETMVGIINNTAWQPPQADLPNKGKTPMLAKACFMSTNNPFLNTNHMYFDMGAPFRRINMNVLVTVKKRFADENGQLKRDLTPCLDHGLDNYYNFEIFKLVRTNQTMKGGDNFQPSPPRYRFVKQGKTIENITEFFKIFTEEAIRHKEAQEAFMKRMDKTQLLCLKCKIFNCTDCGSNEILQNNRLLHDNHPKTWVDFKIMKHKSYNCNIRDMRNKVVLDSVDPEQLLLYFKKDNPLEGDETDVELDFLCTGDSNAAILYYWLQYLPHFDNDFSRSGLTTSYEDYIQYTLRDYDYNDKLPHWSHVRCYLIREGMSILLIKILEKILLRDYALILKGDKKFNFSFNIGYHLSNAIDDYVYNDVENLRVKILMYFAQTRLGKYCIASYMKNQTGLPTAAKIINYAIVNELGMKVEILRTIALLSAGILALIGTISVISNFVPKSYQGEVIKERKCEDNCVEELSDESNDSLQLKTYTFGKEPLPYKESTKIDPYKIPEKELTPLDFSTYRMHSFEQFNQMLKISLLRVQVCKVDEKEAANSTVSLALGKGYFLMNAHTVPKTDKVLMKFLSNNSGSYNNDLPAVIISQTQIKRFDMRDIAIVYIEEFSCMFSCTIKHNFISSSFEYISSGFIYSLDDDNKLVRVKINRFTPTMISDPYHDIVCRGWVQEEYSTKDGDCGSLYVVNHDGVPMILGIHFSKHREIKRMSATSVYLEDLPEIKDYGMTKLQFCRAPDSYAPVKKNKIFLDYQENLSLMYHGEHGNWKKSAVSRVVPTELKEHLEAPNAFYNFKEKPYGKPEMHKWKPQQRVLKELGTLSEGWDVSILKQLRKEIVKYWLTKIPNEELTTIVHPVTWDVAVNGWPGIKYCDGIKRRTSYGFPYNTSKRKFLIKMSDNDPRLKIWQDGIDFQPQIKREILDYFNMLFNGIRGHSVNVANLKDEPTPVEKIENYKLRVYYSGPTEQNMFIKCMFMGVCRLMQRNCKTFGISIGVNANSLEWNEEFHDTFIFKNCFAGDHAGFDLKKFMGVTYHAAHCLLDLCKASGNYLDHEILGIETVIEDTMTWTTDFFGAMITLFQGSSSGKQYTAPLNSVENQIYLMYCWVAVGYAAHLFFVYVRFRILGDDYVVVVHENYSKFNHVTVTAELKKLGLEHTMADKTSKSIPYIPFEQVEYLKRKFVYDFRFGAYLAPLKKTSFIKMLCWSVKSKAVSLEEQTACSINSALQEAYIHGDDAYDALRSFLESFVSKLSKPLQLAIKYNPWPTKRELYLRYWKSSQHLLKAALPESRSQNQSLLDSYCSSENLDLVKQEERMDLVGEVYQSDQNPYLGNRMVDPGEPNLPGTMGICLQGKRLLAENNTNTGDHPTSKVENEMAVTKAVVNTVFAAEGDSEENNIGTIMDPVYTPYTTKHDLASFLSRPTYIFNDTWNETDAVGFKDWITPWSLFFGNGVISNKIQNYAFIRCKLKIKLVINASPFYYGMMGMFYTPLYNKLYISNGNNNTNGQQIMMSQRPGVWVEPQGTTSFEMTLPFFYNKAFLDMRKNANLQDMGRLDFQIFSQLQSANGVSGQGVAFNVYAWAEDVEMSGLTSQSILQSRKVKFKPDEYNYDGPISGPASTLNAVSRRLEDVPVISNFAKATSVITQGIGDIAHYFGFSNVPVITDTQPYTPEPFPKIASSSIAHPIQKLSLQPKQEVSLDTQHEGDFHNEDPLAIKSIATKESFLCGTLWATTAVRTTNLFTSAVVPDLLFTNSMPTSGHTAVWQTPMAAVARMFRFWRGTICFRIKIVRSKFHRGRLNVTWDPGCQAMNSMTTYGNPSVYNVVMDLENDDEIEFEVPFQGHYPFKRVTNHQDTMSVLWSNGPSPTTATPTEYCNGVLQVSVINPLTAPIASSSVNVLIFVKAGDDIEFAQPATISKNFTHLEMQSKKVPIEETSLDPRVYEEMVGERIVSLRELLHRMSISSIMPFTGAATAQNYTVWSFPFTRIPRPSGFQVFGFTSVHGIVTTGNNYQYNFTAMHPINWVLPWFVGYRGSTNNSFAVEKYNQQSTGTTYVPSFKMMVEKSINDNEGITANLTPTSLQTLTFANGANQGNNTKILMQHPTGYAVGGGAITNQATNAGLNVNLPYYNNVSFYFSNQNTTNIVSGSVGPQPVPQGDDKEFDWWNLNVTDLPGTTTNQGVVTRYCGTGPDFQVFFFIHIPVVYYYDITNIVPV